jgi:hypothetical protein
MKHALSHDHRLTATVGLVLHCAEPRVHARVEAKSCRLSSDTLVIQSLAIPDPIPARTVQIVSRLPLIRVAFSGYLPRLKTRCVRRGWVGYGNGTRSTTWGAVKVASPKDGPSLRALLASHSATVMNRTPPAMARLPQPRPSAPG